MLAQGWCGQPTPPLVVASGCGLSQFDNAIGVTMRSLLLLLSSLGLSTSVLAADVTNGAMTDGSTVPTGWTEVWSPDPTNKPVTVARDTKLFNSEPAALRFDNPTGAAYANMSRAIELTPGETVPVRGSLRIPSGTERATLAVQIHDQAGTQVLWQEISSVGSNQADTWINGSIAVTAPATTYKAVIILLVSGAGTAWLDDVKIGR
jgi:hypothetical protein